MPDPPTNAPMTKEELHAYFATIADRYGDLGSRLAIEELDGRRLKVHVDLDSAQVRPGGIVSGPAQFMIIDSVGWMMTVAQLGAGWDAFTTDVAMQFLRPLHPGRVTVEVEVLRRGRRVAMQVTIDPSPDGPATYATLSFVARRS